MGEGAGHPTWDRELQAQAWRAARRDWRRGVFYRSLLVAAGIWAMVAASLLLVYTGREKDRLEARPTVVGTVLESSARLQRSERGPDSIRLTVTFSYSVDGLPLTAEQIWSTMCEFCGEGAVNRKRTSYAPGTDVLVYYDPSTPSSGLIAPRASAGEVWGNLFLLTFLIALALLVAGAILLSAELRRWRSMNGWRPINDSLSRAGPKDSE